MNMARVATRLATQQAAREGAGASDFLQVVVFSTAVETLHHYAKWASGNHPYSGVVVDACLLEQDLSKRDDLVAELTEWGFDPTRTHVLHDDGVLDADLYVDPFDGGIGAEGAYAVPDLGDRAVYIFDGISVTGSGKSDRTKLYRLMRLMAGVPRRRSLAVLFERRADRVCFSQHCISTLNGQQRDAVIFEALEDARRHPGN